jgi:hypothetical protein
MFMVLVISKTPKLFSPAPLCCVCAEIDIFVQQSVVTYTWDSMYTKFSYENPWQDTA